MVFGRARWSRLRISRRVPPAEAECLLSPSHRQLRQAERALLGFFQKIPVTYHCPANRPRPQWLQTVVLYVACDSVGGQFGLDSAGLGPEFVTSSWSGR